MYCLRIQRIVIDRKGDMSMVSRSRACVLGIVTVVLLAGFGPGSLAAAEVVSLEDGTGAVTTARWEGVPLPTPSVYSPVVGKSRRALRFAGAGESVLPVQVNLKKAQTIAVRLFTSGEMELSLRMKSGPGQFRASFAVGPGEQVVLLPTAVFGRSENPVGWEKIEGMAITFPPAVERAPIDLLAIQALPAGASVAGEEIFLLREVSRLHKIGRAWPVYAILSQTDYIPQTYPQRWGRIVAKAPAILQECLQEMFGATLPVNPEGVKIVRGMKNVILLGEKAALTAGAVTAEELSDQGYFGFIIRADDGLVAIAGETRHGDNYGAYRYLEQQGCRFYSHQPLIRHIPTKKKRTLKVWAGKDKPFFECPQLSAPYFWPGIDSARGNAGRTKEAQDKSLFPNGMPIRREHTAGFLVPTAIYYDEHPEYYALLGNGKRMPKNVGPFRTRVCTTHPDVLKISAERTLKWIEQQPEYKFFAVDQGDDWEWCQCERCKAMEYEKGNASDRMLYWVNHVAREVAKKYPDKIIYCSAYGPTQPAPVKLVPEKNVHILYAAWPDENSAPNQFRDFDAAENYLARHQLMGWLKVAPGRIGLYDYHAWGRYTLNGMAHRTLWAARHGMRHGFWHSGVNVSFRHLFNYVAGRLQWDPFQDVGRLKGEFIRAYYGKGAPVMEKIIDGIYDRIEYGDYNWGGVPPADFFTREFTEDILALFDRANEILKGGLGASSDRNWFVSNGIGATRPGQREVPEERLEVFGLLLKDYLARWATNYEKAVAKAREEKKAIPRLGGIAGKLWSWARIRVEPAEKEGQVPAVIRELIADPVSAIKRHRVTLFVEKIPGGLRIRPDAFVGGGVYIKYGWKCEPKPAALVRGTRTGLSRMEARFNIDDEPPARGGVLDIEGQACDKLWAPPVPVQTLLNGEKIFEGPNGFVKLGWSRREFTIPAGILRKGENVLEIRNLSYSDSVVSHWFMLSEVRVKLP